MKRIAILALSFALYIMGCGVMTGALNVRVFAATSVPTQVLWDYDFTQPLNKACSASVATNCVSGFTLSIVTPGNPPAVVGAAQSVPLPATISSTGPTVGINAPYNGPSSLGTYQIQVQVNYKDSTGAVQGGPISAAPLALTPSAALNIRVQ